MKAEEEPANGSPAAHVVMNDQAKILEDLQVQTEQQAMKNQLDIVAVDKEDCIQTVINVEVPTNSIRKKNGRALGI